MEGERFEIHCNMYEYRVFLIYLTFFKTEYTEKNVQRDWTDLDLNLQWIESLLGLKTKLTTTNKDKSELPDGTLMSQDGSLTGIVESDFLGVNCYLCLPSQFLLGLLEHVSANII